MKDQKQFELIERTNWGATVNIDEDNRVLKNVVILGSKSKNNRKYSGQALRSGVPIFEGIRAYLNHDKKAKVRKVEDLIGRFQNVRVEEERLIGDLHLIPDDGKAAKVINIAKTMPDIVGSSIHAFGKFRNERGTAIIEQFVKGSSIDVVTDPATTKGLFEEISEGEDQMELNDLTIAEIKESRKDLYDSIVKEGANTRDQEVADLKEEVKGLKTKVDEFEVKEAMAEKQETVTRLLEESKLPKEAKTEKFTELLMSLTESGEEFVTRVKELIADRQSVVGKKGVINNTEVHEDNEGDEKKIDDKVLADALNKRSR